MYSQKFSYIHYTSTGLINGQEDWADKDWGGILHPRQRDAPAIRQQLLYVQNTSVVAPDPELLPGSRTGIIVPDPDPAKSERADN